MKKLMILMVVHLSLVLTATKAIAQENTKVFNKPTSGLLVSATASTGSLIQPVTISDRVSKKFAKKFAGVSNAIWAKEGKGFEVRFMQDGIQNRAFLTRQGNVQHAIRYYAEKYLPAAVRHQIKSTYYDFAIKSVTEVRSAHTTAYLVTIADETSWKVIRYIDGETDVWETYNKG
jgi:hypothetical protein